MSDPINPAPSESEATDPDTGDSEARGTDAGDSETFNVRQLIKALEPDELGKFEGLSGMLLLNLSQTDYMAAFERYAANQPSLADVDLIRTINHETYHGIQTAASGYGFDRQRRLFAELNSLDSLPTVGDDPETRALIENLVTGAGDDPELKQRAERGIAMLLAQREIEWMNERAAPGDHSIYGALHPNFYRYQDALVTREAEANADGLSIQGLLEGSAVAYTHQLMTPGPAAQAKIEAELATLPAVYRELYDLTVAQAGGRALELLLPAAGLALSYSEPQHAYLPMLRLLMESAPGDGVARGRELMANLPEVEGAGTAIGTAIEVRRGDEAYRIYDKFIEDLQTERFGVDAYAVLADPQASHQLRSFPFALVTADSAQAIKGSMESDEMVARMALMAMVLRVGGRRRQEVQVRKLQVEWARDVIGRLIDNLPEPGTTAVPEKADGAPR